MNEKFVSGLTDGVYILTMLLALFGIHLIPNELIAYLLLPSYLAVFWIYRQVREYGIGSRGRPLLEQSSLTIPRFVHRGFIWVGFLVYAFFPFYISVFIAMTFDPEFGDPAKWPAWLKLILVVLGFILAGFTWYCLASERDEKKAMPENKKRIYLARLLPATAFFLGESSASLADMIHTRWNNSGADLVMALMVFIPLRLIMMRTVGLSAFGMLTFIAAAVFGIISMALR